MKCPSCNKKHRYRNGMRCSCRYHFVLSPKNRYKRLGKVTDSNFYAIINNVSSNNTYYYTKNQLYFEFCSLAFKRKKRCKRIGNILIGLIILFLSLISYFDSDDKMWGAVIFFIILLIFNMLKQGKPVERYVVDNIIQKWVRHKGMPHKLIEKPSLHTSPPVWSEPDIYDYGAESVLILQHDILVDLFVKNNFHTLQKTVIISINGYPDYILQKVKKMVDEKPDLPVFFLHDSTESVYTMSTKHLGLNLYEHPNIDIGLFPSNIKRFKNLKQCSAKHEVPVEYLRYGLLSGLMTASLTDMVPFDDSFLQSNSETIIGYETFG